MNSLLSQPTTRLEGRDARAELVAVKGQGGFEPQRVARTEPGGHRTGGHHGLEEGRGLLGGHGALDAVLTRVAGARRHAGGALPVELEDPEAPNGCSLGGDDGQPLPGSGPLDGDHGALGGDIDATDRRPHP